MPLSAKSSCRSCNNNNAGCPLALDKKLPAVLEGEAMPANPDEAIDLAGMCQQPYQNRYAASARLYAYAFATEPKLAADLNSQHRYNAACSGCPTTSRLMPNSPGRTTPR
jgi:hypothetical protein